MNHTSVANFDFDQATANLSQAKSIIAMMYGGAQTFEVFDNLNEGIKANVFWTYESLIEETLDLLTNDNKD